jgi:hypothetical protein
MCNEREEYSRSYAENAAADVHDEHQIGQACIFYLPCRSAITPKTSKVRPVADMVRVEEGTQHSHSSTVLKHPEATEAREVILVVLIPFFIHRAAEAHPHISICIR